MRALLRRFADAKSVDGRIARAAVISGGLSAGVKAAAFVKEVLVAAVFGVSGQIDAYLIALMLVGIPHGIVVNAFQWTLIPEFVRAHRSHGRVGASALLRQTIGLSLLALGVFLVIWSALLPWLVSHLTKGGGPAAVDTVRNCLVLLTVYYFASGALLMGYGVLQAEKRFVINGAVPIATPLIVALLILAAPEPAAEILAIGLAAGFVAELAIVESILRKSGLTLKPAHPFRGPVGGAFAKTVGKLAVGAAVMALVPLIEQAAAAELGVGAISTLGYASKLPALVSSLAALAIGVAIFPYFAEMLAGGQGEQCRRTLHRYSLVIGVGGAGVAGVLIAASEPIVRLLYARGAFTESAVSAVALAQQGYLVQIPAALVFALSSRLLLAQGRSGAMVALGGAQLLTFGLAVITGLQLADVPALIALCYSLAVTVTATASFVVASRAVAAAPGRLS